MNDGLQVTASLAAFGVLIFFGGLAVWYNRIQAVRRLRQHVRSHVSGQAGDNLGMNKPDVSDLAFRVNRRVGESGFGQQLQLQLTRAGLSLTPNQFLMGQVALGSVLFILGRYALFDSHGNLALLLGLVLALPALILPRFVLAFLMKRRVTRFELQLAQAVDIMAGALQAGSSLPQSFGMVSREMPDPIGPEFAHLIREAAVGVPLEHSLVNMLDRVPSMDLDMLVTAINIQYKVGGNLSGILKTIAHTIRERVRIRGELNTLTAQARLSSYIISGMPVVVVMALFVISPGYIIKLFDPGITRVMLIGGIMGIISGFYVMKRISSIEV